MVEKNIPAPEDIATLEAATQAPEGEAATQAPASEEEAPADLNLNDLAALRSIIDAASTRGAFKANEMVAVGTVYNKLDKFLNQASKAAPANV
jgi:hypothetical protein